MNYLGLHCIPDYICICDFSRYLFIFSLMLYGMAYTWRIYSMWFQSFYFYQTYFMIQLWPLFSTSFNSFLPFLSSCGFLEIFKKESHYNLPTDLLAISLWIFKVIVIGIKVCILEKGTSCAVGGNVTWCSPYGKQYGGSLKN